MVRAAAFFYNNKENFINCHSMNQVAVFFIISYEIKLCTRKNLNCNISQQITEKIHMIHIISDNHLTWNCFLSWLFWLKFKKQLLRVHINSCLISFHYNEFFWEFICDCNEIFFFGKSFFLFQQKIMKFLMKKCSDFPDELYCDAMNYIVMFFLIKFKNLFIMISFL